MGRKRQAAELYVYMNGKKVGVLSRTSAGMLEFAYDPDWLESSLRRPLSLSMPLAKHKYTGAIVENFFDNLLPDSQPIRTRIQKKLGTASTREFDLLWHIGQDCVGALQLLPEDGVVDVGRIVSEPLNDFEIAEILKSYRTMPLGMREDRDFRISLAGAQEKTALLWLDGKWHRPLGTTPTSHILKLPIGYLEHSGIDLSDSVENEWLCQTILKAYGLPSAHTEILSFDGTKVLGVERFDRRWAQDGSWLIRLPQEDMCQALNVSAALKYESDGGPGICQIMELLLGSSNALADRKTFMAQVFLFWVLGAIDGHAKNFSLFINQGGSFQLTPAYDVISVYPLIAKGQLNIKKVNMAMSLPGKNRHYLWEQMLYRHWLATAKRCKFPEEEMVKIIERVVGEMAQVIRRVEAILPEGFPGDVSKPVFAGMLGAGERIKRQGPSPQ